MGEYRVTIRTKSHKLWKVKATNEVCFIRIIGEAKESATYDVGGIWDSRVEKISRSGMPLAESIGFCAASAVERCGQNKSGTL